MTRRGKLLMALYLLWPVFSCGPYQEGRGGLLLPGLSLRAVEPSEWLLGTRVRLLGTGFLDGAMTALIEGEARGKEVRVRVDLGYDGQDEASFVVTEALLAFLPVDGGPFSARITVERTVSGRTDRASLETTILVTTSLVPSLQEISPLEAWPGEEIRVRGDGFLLPGEGKVGLQEGSTWLVFSGIIRGDEETQVFGLSVPLVAKSRGEAFFVLTPDIFGLKPAVFEGSLSVKNVFSGTEGEEVVNGVGLDGISLRIQKTYLSAVGPSPVVRGQWLSFEGRGFVGVDAGIGTITFFTFEGIERDVEGKEVVYGKANPLLFVPDLVEGNGVARLVVRPEVGPKGMLEGFGARPSFLEGRFTPHIAYRNEVVDGIGIEATLQVGRQVQVVYIRFMPTFEDGLEFFGLKEVAALVKERVLEVCRKDYEGVSIEFFDSPPTDFAEYVTVEVMARDPNNAGLFGLDNSFGKDTGNLKMDELLGGYNAASEAKGFYAYGGVFLESFAQFSPSLAKGVAKEFASEHFDRIFGPVMPALGGRPAKASEYPSGPRAEVIGFAARVLGNLIGDTISHEVGHALGLAAVEGDVHDPGDNPGYIMDAGIFRPFEERAQLPGAYPRVFAPYDRAYLEEILPAR